ncbi:MAG: NAD-dependent epimerase/dehydratase family protein [Chloroflexi bacterium]|nr:NAD-dependent epimerase/dehydratase family protein [Chloroflexota bacterium]
MRVFVTGGAGFIGSHTVAALVEAGHDVTVWDDLSTGKLSNLDAVRDSVQVVAGNVRDFEPLHVAIWQARPDQVLHLAAISSVPRSVEEPGLTHSINVEGTVNVLEAARRERIERVVIACSAAIYGHALEVPKTEEMPAAPSSPYGLQKWQSEQYAALYSELYGLTTVSLRYFNVFGPRQDPKSPYSGVISIFLDRLLNGDPVTIHGDGRQTRDFIYVADVVDANLRALTAPLAGHHRFNIGCGRETSIRELHDLLCEVVERRPEPAFGPGRTGDVFRSCADPSRALASLDFAPRYTVLEGLERLVASLRVSVPTR